MRNDTSSDPKLIQMGNKMIEVVKHNVPRVPPEFRDKSVAEHVRALADAMAEAEQLEARRRSVAHAREGARVALRKLLKRGRAAVMALYGDDSPEFAMVGGLRASDRKRPVRTRKEVPRAAA